MKDPCKVLLRAGDGLPGVCLKENERFAHRVFEPTFGAKLESSGVPAFITTKFVLASPPKYQAAVGNPVFPSVTLSAEACSLDWKRGLCIQPLPEVQMEDRCGGLVLASTTLYPSASSNVLPHRSQ